MQFTLRSRSGILWPFLALLATTGFSACATAPTGQTSPVREARAITEVFGDGQKISAVVLRYDADIDNSKLSASDFAVKDRIVSRVYSSKTASKADEGTDGPFVIVEIANTIEADRMPAGPGDAMPAGPGPGESKGSPPAGGGPKLGERAPAFTGAVPLTALVTQTGTLRTVSGLVYGPGTSIVTSSTVDLVVQDFRQAVYDDPKYPGQPLTYNLYVPRNYDASRRYPLVLFMHDAGAVSCNPVQTLTQGLGAISFASSGDQAAHAAFVLAPQYDRVIADDTSTTTDQMDITVDLVKDLLTRFSIDANRLYNTGQSMGGMVSIAMDSRYPGLFAASFLVACQWDPSQVAPLAKKPLWIVVSEGDAKAKPGEDAILGVLKPLGSTVTQATWSAEASPSELQRDVDAMVSAGTVVNYTVFRGGSHRYTWQYAYSIPGIRNWLFSRVKTAGLSAQELFERGDALSRAGDGAGGVAYLAAAAAQGVVRASELLGDLYAEGRGVALDYARAAEFDRAAIKGGSSRASTNLGLLYYRGTGFPQDYEKALEWFEKAAAGGDFKGPRWAGVIYLNGQGPVRQDLEKAAASFLLAAGRGDVSANYYLGLMYEQGLHFPRDYAKAAEWYAKAAPAAGHAEAVACTALGRLYERGQGVSLDLNVALAWYARGSELGDGEAKAALDRLNGK